MAASQGTLQILIEIQAQLADLQSAIGGTDSLGASADATNASLGGIAKQLDAIGGQAGALGAVKSQFADMTAAGGGFLSMLEGGFAIDFASRITEGIVGIAEAFKGAIEEGVHFNARMETTSLGLAATLRSVEPAKYLNFDAARAGADKAMDALREKANSLGVDFHGLAEAYSANLHALIKGGVTKPEEQITLVATLMQAATSKGIEGTQALRDSIDILNGRAQNITLAREIGLENNELKAAAASGQEYAYIMGKLGGYLEAAEANANSFAGRLQIARNEWEQLEGVASKPVFEAAKDVLADIDKALGSIEARSTANAIGIEIASLIGGVKQIATWLDAIPNKFEVIKAAAHAANPLLGDALDYAGGIFDQGKLAALQQEYTGIAQKIRDQVEDSKSAFDVEQARIGLANAIAAAHQKIAESQGVEKTAAEGLLSALDFTKGDFDIIVGQGHDAANAAEGITSALQGANAQLSEMMAKLPTIISEMRQAASAADQARELANEATTAGKINDLSRYQGNNYQYLHDQLQKLGYGGQVNDAAHEVPKILEMIQGQQGARPSPTGGMLGLTPGGANVADPTALGNVDAITKQIAGTQKQIDDLTRQKTGEDQRQAEIAAKSKTDYDDKLRVAEALARGDKAGAEQAKDTARAHALALELSEKQHLSWDDALAAATKLVTEERAGSDATKAATAAKKEGAAASREAANAAKEEAMYSRQVAEEKLKAIQGQGQRIESDPTLFSDQKNKLLLDNYAQQRQQIQAIMQLDTQRIALERNSTNPGVAAQLRADTKSLAEAGLQLAKVNQQMHGLTFTGQMQAGLTRWVTQFGSTAQQASQIITTTLGHAVDGLSNAISGLILGTENWKQAFAQAGQAIIQDIIKIAVQFVVSRLVMWAMDEAAGGAESATSNSLAESATSAWETPAILASIASYGAAAAVGAAAVTAAVAAGQGMASAGYAAGGYTGDGSTSEIAGPVHRREYVFDAHTVSRAGGHVALDRMRAHIHSGGINSIGAGIGPSAGAARGGTAAKPRSSKDQAIHIAMFSDDSKMRDYLSSAKGQKHLVHLTRNNRRRIGIKT